MVALDTAAQAAAAQRPATRRLGNRWLVATAGALVLGGLVPLAVQPGVGHLSAAVMSLLLGAGVAAVGLGLGSARGAFAATLSLMLLLDFGRLPPRAAPGYDEPLALWQTDQTIEATLSGDSAGRILVFAEPVFAAPQAPFGLAALVNGQALAWHCPFQPGQQWLELPLQENATAPLDVRLGLSGTPTREHDYLVVYHSTRHDGYLVELTEDPSVPAPITACSPA